MIDPSEFQELRDRVPFELFLIRMNDGQSYEVVIPSLAVAMQSTLFLGTPARDRFKLLSYQNMTSIDSPAGTENPAR